LPAAKKFEIKIKTEIIIDKKGNTKKAKAAKKH